MSEYIIDVGGGAYNEYAEWIRIRPGLEIHAIEPHPELAAVLRRKTPFVHEMLIGASGASGASGVDLILANPLSCSSTLPFQMNNIRRWKYPAGGKLFSNTGVIKGIPNMTLTQFVERHIPKFKRIDLLNIDVQGNTMSVLNSISSETWERIEKIIVKVYLIDWELYIGQSSTAEVLNTITQHGYHIVSEHVISRGQEKRVIFDRNKTPIEQRQQRAPLPPIRTIASVAASAKINPPKPAKKTIGTSKKPRL